MKKFTLCFVFMAMFLMALTIAANGVSAQSYPSKPIRLIVPFPAGGAADIPTRIIAEKLTEGLR
jgi:tripartite-type tricarboxylate transporter receptor subunit TctC